MEDIRHDLIVCSHCNGNGWRDEHDPDDLHIDGCSNCPIQVQCECCQATGLLWRKDIQTETEKETVKDEDEDDDSLPF